MIMFPTKLGEKTSKNCYHGNVFVYISVTVPDMPIVTILVDRNSYAFFHLAP